MNTRWTLDEPSAHSVYELISITFGRLAKHSPLTRVPRNLAMTEKAGQYCIVQVTWMLNACYYESITKIGDYWDRLGSIGFQSLHIPTHSASRVFFSDH